ncbi:hypothetical protein [Roseobacter weihaiensis]|uniref:hypothetical protein n=1 Tax=Roseobacter weihaiensis TaxID=2763262 RepID=UPI001D0AF23E|nr:hypothetical protein [Roseobacter sp. H9]
MLRFSYLGYRRLFGVITDEEEQERLTAQQNILDALERLAELDRETAEQIAEEAVAYFEAQHAELRLLDLEYRLGLTSEEALLRAYEDVAYLDASVLLGGTAFTAGAAKLGINLTRLRPTAALNALRAGRNRFDDMINTRRREITQIANKRYAELFDQGHGPQRHDGDVTRQMLIDRVMRNEDPMIHTDPLQASQVAHPPTRNASRIIDREDYVAAEAFVRRSPDYDQARNLALEWLTDPSRGRRMEQVGNIEINGEGRFSVRLPIKDVLGSDSAQRVEGVARFGSVKNPQGYVDVDFENGSIVAVYKFPRDLNGELVASEPALITLFPEALR